MTAEKRRRFRVVLDITMGFAATEAEMYDAVQMMMDLRELSGGIERVRMLSYEKTLRANARRDNDQIAYSLHEASACIAEARRLIRQGRIDR